MVFDGMLTMVNIVSASMILFAFYPKLNQELIILILYIVLMSSFLIIYFVYNIHKERKTYNALIELKENKNIELKETIKNLQIKATLSEQISRNSKYAEALQHLNLAFAPMHDILRDSFEVDLQNKQLLHEFIERYIFTLKSFCTHMSNSFALITGKNCAFCIKLIEETTLSKVDCSVYTLVRDNVSEARRKNENNRTIKHWIKANSSYSSIISKTIDSSQRSFFSNRLPFLPRYNNSSFQIYGEPKTTYEASTSELLAQWTLPYKSTIVTAISPNIIEKFNEDSIIGFICVDSADLDVFNEVIDKELLVGVSDGIYNTLKRLVEILKLENNQNFITNEKFRKQPN